MLDVQLRVLDGEDVRVDDDDGAGGLASRVVFRAPRTGSFTVRVMAHGPWGNYGSYRLSVTAPVNAAGARAAAPSERRPR